MATEEDFSYSNHSGRGQSLTLKLASLFLPGVRKIQRQIAPYAEAWMAVNTKALRANGPLWVVLGDSMSQGVGASAFDKGWVGQLRDILAARGMEYRIVNLSISGARTEDVLELQLPAMWRLGLKPDLVTVLIGANNISRSKHRRHIVNDLEQLVERLPSGTIIGSITGTSAEARRANALLAEQIDKRHFAIADMNYAFRPPTKARISEDLYHPNDLGYAEIAKVFADAIKRQYSGK
ncbi:MAG TPA: SGNH/GDSL hydrolase family protein [Candidatus Saccharimonadales bacterium]